MGTPTEERLLSLVLLYGFMHEAAGHRLGACVLHIKTKQNNIITHVERRLTRNKYKLVLHLY